jgi:hypothetical protein
LVDEVEGAVVGVEVVGGFMVVGEPLAVTAGREEVMIGKKGRMYAAEKNNEFEARVGGSQSSRGAHNLLKPEPIPSARYSRRTVFIMLPEPIPSAHCSGRTEGTGTGRARYLYLC